MCLAREAYDRLQWNRRARRRGCTRCRCRGRGRRARVGRRVEGDRHLTVARSTAHRRRDVGGSGGHEGRAAGSTFEVAGTVATAARPCVPATPAAPRPVTPPPPPPWLPSVVLPPVPPVPALVPPVVGISLLIAPPEPKFCPSRPAGPFRVAAVAPWPPALSPRRLGTRACSTRTTSSAPRPRGGTARQRTAYRPVAATTAARRRIVTPSSGRNRRDADPRGRYGPTRTGRNLSRWASATPRPGYDCHVAVSWEGRRAKEATDD